MQLKLKMLVGAVGMALAAQAAAQITFYEDEGFRGRSLTTESAVPSFGRYGFNDNAESAIISNGRWEVCDDPGFRGRCVTLGPGSYVSLRSMSLGRAVSSVRPIDQPVVGYVAPAPYVRPSGNVLVAGDDGQRYQARVIYARAVLGPPGQQCWVEKQQIGPLELPGAIVGGMVDVLSGRQSTQYIQHCASVPSDARPEYWDVTYEFRGIEHHVQLSGPPGPTIAVNGNGEPRG